MTSTFEIGVDIGGTFTDMVCRDCDGTERIVKIPTTRADPSAGARAALDHAGAAWGIAADAVARFVHGTTVATNAVLERRGAKIGLITTEGFKDTLEIGRQKRSRMYDLALLPETPVFLAPGARRLEVAGRVAPDGRELVPLDEEAVVEAADALVAEDVEGIAIAFLFSFANPAHEQRAAELIARRHPGLALSLSAEVDPAFREYERTAVTAYDAYVKPVLDRYLANLEAALAGAGVPAPLQVMLSRGGVSSARIARRRPVRLLLSGPAAGVIGGRMVGLEAGIEDLITVDIGGTSCDIAMVEGGRPVVRAEGLIAGQSIRVPMIDVNAIGAGGGSIAWLDAAGGLRVGPRSAGAEPGPAAYGQGGEAATVTDASLVLGYLNPENFAAGALRLDPALAEAAIETQIAKPLGLSVRDAALGIHRVLNASMAEGIRLVSIRRGHDPRRFALVALGGGGPLHAPALADHLGIDRIVVPRHPGVLSAAGLLAAPVEQELSTAYAVPLAEVVPERLAAAYTDLDRRCAELMAGEAVDAAAIKVRHYADVCYIGQGYHLEVAVDLDQPAALDRLYQDFLAAHDRIYGYAAASPARIVNLRTVHSAGGRAAEAPRAEEPERPGEAAPMAERQILLPAPWGEVAAAVFERDDLAPGVTFRGPAIVEQADTTVLIAPDWRARAIPGGSLILERGE
ncbi:MAG: hydantoinase/oxoprolinase family protein [Alphaproteobacteria bacterium]|jgi:N-methylhydantoinase A/oxoprolinase/acetone carboxylase beta subunit|nr:hydantoinase/oxoprolinase family protein [Alphaproteobacteria bacterium]